MATKTTTAQHTPGPWALHPRVTENPPRIYCRGVIIATVDTSAPDPGEREVNAAFIIRACNAHDELLAALDAFVASHEAEQHMGGACPCGLCEAAGTAIHQARGDE